MTLEYLKEQKEKYQTKADYFKKLGFDNLSVDFQGVVVLIEEMEKCVEEKNNTK